MWYNAQRMTKAIQDLMNGVSTWPPEGQNELAEYAREINARRMGDYVLSDEERTAVEKGIAEADRGAFAS